MVLEYCNDSESYGSRSMKYGCLDTPGAYPTMSVYCTCGRIVVLDRDEMKLKLSLGKELECMACRNARISDEIDAMNDHYNGIDEDDWVIL